MNRCISLVLLVLFTVPGGASAQVVGARTEPLPPASVGAPHATGRVFEVPVVLIKGFPFVDGEIGGRRGKLMFDLGATPALTINSHAVPIPGGISDGTGHFGSGQQVGKVRYPLVAAGGRVAASRFGAVRDVEGRDGTVIERDITPDFIGWVGLNFFAGYVARIDYARGRVTFFRDDADGTGLRQATAGRKVIGTIAMTNPADHPNLRLFRAMIGETEVTVGIDTGFHATAYVTDEQAREWRASGHMRGRRDGKQMIDGIRSGAVSLRLSPVDVESAKAPFAPFLPREDQPVVMMGYEFFRQYIVLLDYRRNLLELQRN